MIDQNFYDAKKKLDNLYDQTNTFKRDNPGYKKWEGDYLDFENQVRLDIEYIQSSSIWLDIKLLFLTIPAVLLGKGAY